MHVEIYNKNQDWILYGDLSDQKFINQIFASNTKLTDMIIWNKETLKNKPVRFVCFKIFYYQISEAMLRMCARNDKKDYLLLVDHSKYKAYLFQSG